MLFSEEAMISITFTIAMIHFLEVNNTSFSQLPYLLPPGRA
jgi:hypothetical protein